MNHSECRAGAERAADQIESEREWGGGKKKKKKKEPSLPTYIKHLHGGCQSAADTLHKFQWFEERRAQTRLSRRCSRAPDLFSSLSFGAARNKSPGQLHRGSQVSSRTFKSFSHTAAKKKCPGIIGTICLRTKTKTCL